ncbi:MAG: hypothetical protein HY209_04330 [Candidatus Omnitrophica bacterium]|nr:hypothetical protein [Candidatus Omnitrophota bacterium]
MKKIGVLFLSVLCGFLFAVAYARGVSNSNTPQVKSYQQQRQKRIIRELEKQEKRLEQKRLLQQQQKRRQQLRHRKLHAS